MFKPGRFLLLIAALALLTKHPIQAGDKLISLQGKLTDGQSNALSGSRVVTFRLYNNLADPIASRVWEDSLNVSFSNGLYNVALGSGTTLDAVSFDKPYYLGLQVAGDNDEMLPRQLLGATPYSLGSLGDFNIKKDLVVSGAITSSGTITSYGNLDAKQKLFVTDNAGIGTTNPTVGGGFTPTLHLRAPYPAIALEGTGAAKKWGMGVDSLGAFHLFETTSNGYGNRLFIKNDGNVGVGTVSPTNKLHVVGNVKVEGSQLDLNDTGTFLISQNTPSSALILRSAASSYIRFDTGGANPRMVVNYDGNVGIGTVSPTHTLTINGSAWVSGGSWAGSDRKWKKNIQTLGDGTLDKVLKLRGVTYEWRRNEFPELKFNDSLQVGVIAQEVEAQFPMLVTTGPEGDKSVDYSKLSAVLIEAVKAQQKQIERLQNELEALKRKP